MGFRAQLNLNCLCQFAMLVTTKSELPVNCVPETGLKLQRVTLQTAMRTQLVMVTAKFPVMDILLVVCSSVNLDNPCQYHIPIFNLFNF